MSPMGVTYYDDLDRLRYYYPHYESPFRVAINKNFSLWMQRYCAEWAIHNSGTMRHNAQCVETIRNSDLGIFAAIAFPTANWHRLEKLIKWAFMFFIADDYHDILTNLSKDKKDDVSVDFFWQDMIDMLEAAADNNYDTNPKWADFVKGIQSVLRELYFDYNREQVRRLVGMIKNYIQGNMLEIKWFDKEKGDVNNNDITPSVNGSSEKSNDEKLPDWKTYMAARLGSVGGQMSLQLLEYAKNIQLSDAEFNHPLLGKLEQAVSEEMTLVNDYLTFRKEVAENDFLFSKMRHAFPVLVNEGLSLQEAVDRVHQLIVAKDNDIFELMRQILRDPQLNETPEAHARLETYLEGVNEFVGGYWRHAVTAKRYHGLQFRGAIAPEGQFIYHRDETIIKPTRPYHYNWLKPIPENVQPQ